MKDHFEAWREVFFERHQIAIESVDFYQIEGLPVHEIAATLGEKYSISLSDPDQYVRDKEFKYLNKIRQSNFFPGVEPFLDQLDRQQISIGLVTAGRLDRLKSSLPSTFLERFKGIVTGELGLKGKPHPDPYLKGLELLGLNPDECIAVENAPLGIRSAKKAGLKCIGIASTVSKEKLEEADWVFRSFKEFADLSVEV